MMKRTYTIGIDGNRNLRWIVKEIIYKNVIEGVKSEPFWITVGTGDERERLCECCYYDFKTSGKVFKKIVKELEFIGLKIYYNKKGYCEVGL